jgi:GNAT superfamily N-acetyltransferase
VEIVTYPDARRFLDRVRSTLEAEEAKHSLMLGIAAALAETAHPVEGEPVFVTVEGRGRWTHAALINPPYPVILTVADNSSAAGYRLLARHFRDTGYPLAGVTSTPDAAEAFTVEWERLHGAVRAGAMRQRIYQLERVEVAPVRPGMLRPALPSDTELVGRWLGEFQAEALGDEDRRRAEEIARRRIGVREIHLWDDGEPRSIAGWSRPTRHTVTVNAVYTPPAFRGMGYATATVAALSRQFLAKGYRVCVLYADLANPTSNGIYQRMGYRPVCDSLHYRFRSSEDAT